MALEVISKVVFTNVLKKHFDEPKNGSPSKTETQEILNILESMKLTDSAKKSVSDNCERFSESLHR